MCSLPELPTGMALAVVPLEVEAASETDIDACNQLETS